MPHPEHYSGLVESKPHVRSVVVAAGPLRTALAANNTFVVSAIVVAKITNTHTLYIGTSGVGEQIVPLAPGGVFTIAPGPGHMTDLNDYYINGTAAEGVDVFYAFPE